MGDVRITELSTAIPAGSNLIPFSTASATYSTLASSLTAGSQPLGIIGVSVSKSGSQTGVVNDTITTATFNAAALWDTSSFYNGTNTLTVPAGLGGIYAINGRLTTSTTNAYIKNSVIIRKNDSSDIGRTDSSIGGNGVDVAMTTSIIHSLIPGDTIKLRGYCQGFWSLNTFKDTVLTMVRIGTL